MVATKRQGKGMTMVIHTHTHTDTHTHTGHTQTHRHTHTHTHTHTRTHIHAVADPGGFPRFLETSQNLQHVGWVWSIIMGVVNYYGVIDKTTSISAIKHPRRMKLVNILNSDD